MLQFSVQLNYAEYYRATVKGAQPVLLAFLAQVRNEMRRLFELPKSGKPGPRVRRSAPGEAPARQSGRLREEMEILPVPLAPELHLTAPYAAALNDGTLHIAPRPYVQPAIEDVRRTFVAGERGLE